MANIRAGINPKMLSHNIIIGISSHKSRAIPERGHYALTNAW